MSDSNPILFWFRRDLRLSDHPGFAAACATKRPVIPIFIHDGQVDALGAAPKWRLGLGLAAFAARLDEKGSRLILRRGNALETLRALVAETGATAIWWSRAYDPDAIARDSEIKQSLGQTGLDARSFAGHLLFEPWTVSTGEGKPYRVYSPFWRAVKSRDVAAPDRAPAQIPAPESWPQSDKLEDWRLGAAMNRGAEVVRAHVSPGEEAALDRLYRFCGGAIETYKNDRNRPDLDATSNLSEYLSLGEIGPRRIWQAGLRAREEGASGAEHFLKELVWREFAYHLMYHTPELLNRNWRPDWDGFPWKTDERAAEIKAWKRGRTGMAFVDAAMREMYGTGRMHNRARMVVASYLTKHLMTHWKVGMDWFEDCLVDWDPASNAMGWQWVAGSGPDAAPYFRVFNPETQAEKFDPDGTYRRRWIAEGQADPTKTALSYFDAIPRSWAMSPGDDYPAPIVSARDGRAAALNAYENRDF
ncbi:deoxyribodipyrimidine photo-lyase [Cribrihabitans marinus]|uniref:Deoxyribodipyrimidine photo-lyase n=1 Tax=Cribrihabitans marinus TaxID=1227549 RepID=A0A1H6QSJ7_9RHOB|nr:deoxyribodipyrimidine photo-lyase [Cribrihabitans marinus]GGH18711.1 deoxyribodipyrimidine photo-lyase [Cribrihabitans marinus]SEI42225.1 deoxyribodipyrimidine photo-lyase [Cribrihabitans marinus]